jgi:hypothetical protein
LKAARTAFSLPGVNEAAAALAAWDGTAMAGRLSGVEARELLAGAL